MKILHTADWHLGDRLGRIDRRPELHRAVRQVAKYCDEHAVDVLIVAGDLFSELPRADGLREEVTLIQATFAPFFQRGGTMIACTGNHDHEGFCRTLRTAMGLAAPAVDRFGALVLPGRLYLADEPTLIKLEAAEGVVQFVLMPYPQPNTYLVHEAQQKYSSLAERKQLLQAAFIERLRQIRQSPEFDRALPSVLVAHVSVAGAQVEYLFRVAPGEDILCPSEALGDEFRYIALGHIHKPHHLPGRPNARYPGSLARLDLGESTDRREVLLFDLATPNEQTALPIEADPIYRVTVHEPTATISRLKKQYPDHSQALVDLEVHYQAGVDDLQLTLKELETIFPRWYQRVWTEINETTIELPTTSLTGKGFEETVRDYVEGQLSSHTLDVQAAIRGRLENLLNHLADA